MVTPSIVAPRPHLKVRAARNKDTDGFERRPRLTVWAIGEPELHQLERRASGGTTAVFVAGTCLGSVLHGFDCDYESPRWLQSLTTSKGERWWFMHPKVTVRGKPFSSRYYPRDVSVWIEGATKPCELEYPPSFCYWMPDTHCRYSQVDLFSPEHNGREHELLLPGAVLEYEYAFQDADYQHDGPPIFGNGELWFPRRRPHNLKDPDYLLGQIKDRRVWRLLRRHNTSGKYERFIEALRGRYGVNSETSLTVLERTARVERAQGNGNGQAQRRRVTEVFDDYHGLLHRTVLLCGIPVVEVERQQNRYWVVAEEDTSVYIFESQQDAERWASRQIDYATARQLGQWVQRRGENWKEQVRDVLLGRRPEHPCDA